MTDLIPLAVLGALLLMTATAWRRRSRRFAVVAAVVTAGVGYWVVTNASAIQIAVVAVLTVAVVAVVLVRAVRTEATITRWGNRSRRNSGVATTLDVARFASGPAMRRKATTVRPSLQELSRRERSKLPTTAVAVELVRVGAMRVWASVEDVVVVFGGPRRGKTGWLAGVVIDAPGAVVTTSTRLDLMEITAPLRREGGRPVWVFNPGDLGGIPSTLGFNPLDGCADPIIATERATDMIPQSEGDQTREFWESQARRVLAALMHAAALDDDQDRSMRDVLGWVADPDGTQLEVTFLLRRSPEPAFVQDITQFVTTNNDTRSSITSSVMPALGWLNSQSARAAAAGGGFDVAELLRSRGTVYLLGRHEAHTAPLLAALTGYIAREARQIAAHQPGGRLDPPLMLALDEAARVAPVPLPDWSGDAGGSGITIVACFQSRADLADRWGKTGAAKILNNAGAVMLFGGTKDPDDLEAWSRLAGDRDEPVVTTGKDGKVTSRSVRKTPVLSGSQLANLPAFRAVIFRAGMPPAIGTPRMAWRRRDVKAQAKTAAWRWLLWSLPPSRSPVTSKPPPPADNPRSTR